MEFWDGISSIVKNVHLTANRLVATQSDIAPGQRLVFVR
jgi:hypothetical protein